MKKPDLSHYLTAAFLLTFSMFFFTLGSSVSGLFFFAAFGCFALGCFLFVKIINS